MKDNNYVEAISTFEKLDGYRDSFEMISKCKIKIYSFYCFSAKNMLY